MTLLCYHYTTQPRGGHVGVEPNFQHMMVRSLNFAIRFLGLQPRVLLLDDNRVKGKECYRYTKRYGVRHRLIRGFHDVPSDNYSYYSSLTMLLHADKHYYIFAESNRSSS